MINKPNVCSCSKLNHSIAYIVRCYNDDCNQKEWIKQKREGFKDCTIIEAFWEEGDPLPRCPHCNEEMTITGNI